MLHLAEYTGFTGTLYFSFEAEKTDAKQSKYTNNNKQKKNCC